MSTESSATSDAPGRSERIAYLSEKFRRRELVEEEAWELFDYLEEDLQRAKRNANHEAVRRLRLSRGAVESYIALLQSGPNYVPLTPER